ncbi:alpha/beta hydrolase family protein [Herbiconiux daphne]|uniref:Alpha/beta fold hydrolase n=1 Tax=Herbiconiux daphne TaxID=2970914 RepID=A0ABT2H536_9MICO|nr:alpha/beta hydrolase [Herbiconiux daphne]MCS5735043.1 alpha/beta fold hydrolase [Herbiconiux daphne]
MLLSGLESYSARVHREAVAAAAGAGIPTGTSTPPQPPHPETRHPMATTPTIFFHDHLFDDQFARTLAAVYAGASDLGEAFSAARSIGARATPDSWHTGWLALARRVDAAAAAADAAGHSATTSGAYLRAAEYYRQAFFFIRHDIDDPRVLDAYADHVRTFQAAAPHLRAARAEAVEIPYDGTTLHGWFFAPDAATRPRPTVISPDGYDSTAEDGLAYVIGALERGYNVVTFDGPGQGRALYREHLFMRPDFEAVLTPVVDWLHTRPTVDVERLVLFGRSFAGYLAPRAAAFEHRIAALVCDPPDPNLGSHLPDGIAERIAAPTIDLEMRLSAEKREFFGARMATHGLTDVAEYFATLRTFDMTPVAGQITCPTLLVECEGDPLAAGGGADALAAALTAPTTRISLSAESGAGGHCGGLGQRVWDAAVFDWLDTVLPEVA